MRAMLIALALAAGAPLFAQQELKVGDLAPEIGATYWLETPRRTTLAEFEGEVVLLKAWGLDCPPCLKQVPHLNDLHEKYGQKGLHIIGLFSQLHSLEDIGKFVADKKIKYPIAIDYNGDAYNTPVLPKVWIVGVDGKIIFVGSEGYDKAIETEVAKVKRPGLGKSEISAELEPAAKAYIAGKYADAQRLAQKVADTPDINEKVSADAEYILSHVSDRLSLLRNRVESGEVQGDYPAAQSAGRTRDGLQGRRRSGGCCRRPCQNEGRQAGQAGDRGFSRAQGA